jgi:hypothetical protein
MHLVLLVPLLVLVTAAAGASWVAARTGAQLALLRAEVSALAQLRAARDLLHADVERTRLRLGAPAEVRRPSADR